MIPLTKILGKLMPEKTDGVCVCDCIPCKTYLCVNCELGNTKGYKDGDLCHEGFCCEDERNKMISQISKITISADREVWARELHWIQGINSNPKLRDKAWDICHEKEDYYKQADLLISSLPALLIAEVRE